MPEIVNMTDVPIDPNEFRWIDGCYPPGLKEVSFL